MVMGGSGVNGLMTRPKNHPLRGRLRQFKVTPFGKRKKMFNLLSSYHDDFAMLKKTA